MTPIPQISFSLPQHAQQNLHRTQMHTAIMINRDRLINAVIYYAANTRCCGKIKLFKLLYLLDFEHFKQTGKSVTGFDYQAWKFGPVPVSLMEEWEEPEEDWIKAVHIVPEKVIDHVRQTVVVNDGIAFNDENFTPRQVRIMSELAVRYHNTLSPTMIDVTHTQNGAWDKVWCGGKGARSPIPYELSIPEDDVNRATLIEIANEQHMYEASKDIELALA